MAKDLKAAARQVGEIHSDAVSRDKDGNLLFMKGFFYKMGQTSKTFADEVSTSLTLADIPHEVVEHYEQWKPFRGGDTVKKGSHFGVRIKVLPKGD